MTREQIEQMTNRELDKRIALMTGWQEIPDRDWAIIEKIHRQKGQWSGVPDDVEMEREMITPEGFFSIVRWFSREISETPHARVKGAIDEALPLALCRTLLMSCPSLPEFDRLLSVDDVIDN
jgi:hypothetical protein